MAGSWVGSRGIAEGQRLVDIVDAASDGTGRDDIGTGRSRSFTQNRIVRGRVSLVIDEEDILTGRYQHTIDRVIVLVVSRTGTARSRSIMRWSTF